MIRLLNICVIVALVVAAAYVYRIKFESTRKAAVACERYSGAAPERLSMRCFMFAAGVVSGEPPNGESAGPKRVQAK